jgi:DNA-binding CsgD family transcriptional regulator
MLFGREVECGRIESLLDEARGGRSGTLVVRGEAGIGKSALCGRAVELAAGLTVLATRGVETESELAFASLAQLFRPALERLGKIPAPQASALAGALAIGPPVPGDRFTICAATLSLLAAVAEDGPALVVVDDAQWLDRSSAEALLFAARRLDSEGVAVLFAVRDGQPSVFDRADLPELVVTGLEAGAASALLASRSSVPIADDVAGRILRAAAGNPLALGEVPALLSSEQLAGAEPIGEDLPTPPTVVRAFSRYLDALPESSREALLVAAVSDSTDLDEIGTGLAALGLDPGALRPAEETGLVFVEGSTLEFRHPLLRSAVRESASAVARRAVHRALADVAGAQSDNRAWHLAAAAPDDDEAAAAALEEAALRARERGGYAEAASALERAARLTGDDVAAARRLRESARDHMLVGRVERAVELLDEALPRATEPALRARILHLRATIEMWHGSPPAAVTLLTGQAEQVAADDPDRAASMLTDAAWACFLAADIRHGLEAADRACSAVSGLGGWTEARARGVRAIALTLGGDALRALPLFAEYRALLDHPRSALTTSQPFRPDGLVLTWFEEYDLARDRLTRAIDGARAQSALGALPWTLVQLAELDFRTGRWASAFAGASEAVRIAEEVGQRTALTFSLAVLARIEAGRGREDDAAAHANRALELAHRGVNAAVAFARSALGLLELGHGRGEHAIVQLERLAQRAVEHGLREPAVIQWTPDLIEAYVRAGRLGDAERLLREFEQVARETQRTWALATAARCRGLLAEDSGEEHFLHALELHDLTPTPFDRARTQLCLGERLRRGRRRADAREWLVGALEVFERLGAEPWAERARAELAASGETVRRRDAFTEEELTPQELQVALVVARGATNKEAGAALFLSPKTIETHLGRVYRKLNVRSRTELARLLASETAPRVAA